jgi:hypothetical protein
MVAPLVRDRSEHTVVVDLEVTLPSGDVGPAGPFPDRALAGCELAPQGSDFRLPSRFDGDVAVELVSANGRDRPAGPVATERVVVQLSNGAVPGQRLEEPEHRCRVTVGVAAVGGMAAVPLLVVPAVGRVRSPDGLLEGRFAVVDAVGASDVDHDLPCRAHAPHLVSSGAASVTYRVMAPPPGLPLEISRSWMLTTSMDGEMSRRPGTGVPNQTGHLGMDAYARAGTRSPIRKPRVPTAENTERIAMWGDPGTSQHVAPDLDALDGEVLLVTERDVGGDGLGGVDVDRTRLATADEELGQVAGQRVHLAVAPVDPHGGAVARLPEVVRRGVPVAEASRDAHEAGDPRREGERAGAG